MQTLDQSRIEAFAGQIASEVGAALNAALVTVGDELGLYRAMADAQPIRADEDMHVPARLREKYRRLASRVAPADDDDFFSSA